MGVPFLADAGIKTLLWDQTWTFGFRKLKNGKIEVFHEGHKFVGPWPIRLIIFFHQRYVLWACEKYINGTAFGTDDLDAKEEQMECLPLHKTKEAIARLRAARKKTKAILTGDEEAQQEAIAKTKEKFNMHFNPGAKPRLSGTWEKPGGKVTVVNMLKGAHPVAGNVAPA